MNASRVLRGLIAMLPPSTPLGHAKLGTTALLAVHSPILSLVLQGHGQIAQTCIERTSACLVDLGTFVLRLAPQKQNAQTGPTVL